MFNKSKKGGLCTVCSICSWIMMVLGIAAFIAAAAGVYQAHFLATGATFGTTSGSLSIVALVATLFFNKKMMENCTCNTK